MDFNRLYDDHIGLVYKWVRRYAGLCQDRGDVDPEDLMHAGFCGMCEALETFKPGNGTWSTWASYYIRSAIRKALGLHTSKLYYTVIVDGVPVRKRFCVHSLDAPAYGSDDCDVSLVETIADDSIPAADEALFQDEDAKAVRAAVESLSDPDLRLAITERYFGGKSLKAIADAQGLSPQRIRQQCGKAIRQLAKDKRIRQIWKDRSLDEETRFICRKSVKSFFSSGSSSVEDQVLWREKQRNMRKPDRLDALVEEWNQYNAGA